MYREHLGTCPVRLIYEVSNMKLKFSFEDVNMGDEFVSVPVGEGTKEIHGVLKMNNAGKEILDLLREETTTEKIIAVLSSKYENDKETIIKYVNQTVATLRKAGVLSE